MAHARRVRRRPARLFQVDRQVCHRAGRDDGVVEAPPAVGVTDHAALARCLDGGGGTPGVVTGVVADLDLEAGDSGLTACRDELSHLVRLGQRNGLIEGKVLLQYAA